jgi:hypothetical protein
MAQSKHRRIRVRGRQREDIDADLMAQIVIMMGRQLAREARGEAPDEDETLPTRRTTTGESPA